MRQCWPTRTRGTRSPAALPWARLFRRWAFCRRTWLARTLTQSQYVLNNPGRAPACCSSREGDALFEEMRQEGNLIAAINAVCQIVPEPDVQLAARRL